ncbi:MULTISPECIES: hypothetical protein [unclassified Kribbella]|uniref:hypothetical protein n=1 Tax=unclassified Kribbella TaxID=2644121 RepID=UPI00307897C9
MVGLRQGVNARANSLTLLLFVLSLLWVVDSFVFGLVFAVTSGNTRRQKLPAVLAALAAGVALAWSVFA